MNDTLNESELARLRDFVYNAPATNNLAEFTNFLLLNERGDTGERFWNLLRMTVLVVDDPDKPAQSARYVLAIQTPVDIGMISSLRYPTASSEKEYAVAIAPETRSFTKYIDKVRFELRLMEGNGRTVPEQEEYAHVKLRSWLKQNTSDFIGDHYVTRAFGAVRCS